MMRAPELRRWLDVCCGSSSALNCVVVAGGGHLADDVRELAHAWVIPERAAHELAVTAMHMHGRLLHALAPKLDCVEQPAELRRRLGQSVRVIWTPMPDAAPELPRSWDVTSDSMSLWLAQQLQAEALMLVKSCRLADAAACDARVMAEQGLVDAYFPRLMRSNALPVRWLHKGQYGLFRTALDDARLAGTSCGVAAS